MVKPQYKICAHLQGKGIQFSQPGLNPPDGAPWVFDRPFVQSTTSHNDLGFCHNSVVLALGSTTSHNNLSTGIETTPLGAHNEQWAINR